MKQRTEKVKLAAIATATFYVVGFLLVELSLLFPEALAFLAPFGQFYYGFGETRGAFNLITGLPIVVNAIIFSCFSLKVYRQSRDTKMHLRDLGSLEDAISAHAIVSVADKEANIIEVNEKFRKVFGYSNKEVIGRKHSFLYPEQGSSEAFSEVHRTVCSGKAWTGNQRLISKTGTIVFVHSTIFPLYDAQGNHSRTVSIRTDVSGQRIAEAAKHLTSVLENMPDEVFMFDVDTLNILYMNKKARTRCQWPLDGAKARRITEAGKIFDEAGLRAYLDPLIINQKTEVTDETRNGDLLYERTTRLHSGPDGKPVFVTFLRNVTERGKAEQHKLASVSMVSHELRTPLTSIKGSLRLLQSGAVGELSKDVVQIVDIAERNSERLLLMVNDILDLEKITSGHMEFEMQPVDLKAFILEAAEANKGYADEQNVHFVTRLPEMPASVIADPNRLMQILSNLMSNAAKFSPKQAEVALSIEDAGKYWRIGISDKGPGIRAEAHETLFDSFVQAKSADGKKRSGTGLGLAITKKIVQHLGGTIDFQTEIGVGTTFFVDLPKVDAEQNTGEKIAFATAAE